MRTRDPAKETPVSEQRPPGTRFSDTHGREVRYLRVSVTDRCNLRCLYCRGGMETFIPHSRILRYEELERLIDLITTHGVEKVRLTGGEPFARKGFTDFLLDLRARHPALDIRITTNGTLALPHLDALRRAGVNAVNLSLDTLDRATYERITGRDLFAKTRDCLDALLEARIPLKINAVALRGVNDHELPAFVELAATHPVDVRFIEFMPVGEGSRWRPERFWPASEILADLSRLAALRPVQNTARSAGPARMYALAGGLGRIGLITPLSHHFCGVCNRLRITSDGRLRTCLFADREYRLRAILRHPRLGPDVALRVIERAARRKPLGADILNEQGSVRRRMIAIGG